MSIKGGIILTRLIGIPPGIQHGESIRYPKLVKDQIDVVIRYTLLPDPIWHIEQGVLLKRQDISIWELIVGTELEVELINGSTIRVRIPEKTQIDTLMRVRGKGINGGDMLLALQGKIPKDIPEPILKVIKDNLS